jgi:hypothetical protein
MILLAVSILSVGGLISCKKDNSQTSVSSNTELLTKAVWKYEIRGLDENNNGTIEASESDMLSCQSDDTFSFNAHNTGVYNPGSAQCAPDDVSITYNWYFSANETELAIFAFPEKISKLDQNTLEIYHDDQNSQSVTVKYITRFTH